MKITEKDIEYFVECAHRVGRAGLTVCSSGNLSIRIGDEVMISGTGSWVPELTPDRVAVVDYATGEVLNGVRPSIESVFHLGVLREREAEGVTCVLHYQSPYATAIACRKTLPKSLNFTAEMPIYVGEEIPAVPYLRPGSPELAQHVIDAMKDHNTIFLLKHGQVTCGHHFNEALERAMFLELGCRTAVLNGDNIDPLNAEELHDLHLNIIDKKV